MRAVAIALIALTACASPATQPPMKREPPLPQMFLDFALASPGNDGGTRAQFLSLLGREDLFDHPERQTCAPLQREGVVVDAVSEIGRLAEGRRVVIINEAHEVPQHRAFIADVAARLYRDGFTIYAAETFEPAAREPRAWPHVKDGLYSREPTFGALQRRLRGLGYRFVEYEDFSPPNQAEDVRAGIARREAMQAANLQRILVENPQARLFVHVGFDHLYERPDSQGNIWMAQRLKEATGIDPLTIDQTRLSSGAEQFTFCDPMQRPSTMVDYRVGSPNITFENGRPAWRQRAGQKPVPVPAAIVNSYANTIIEARLAHEPDEAVPVDRLLLRPGESLPLLLAPGRYRIESWTQEQGYSEPVEINVD